MARLIKTERRSRATTPRPGSSSRRDALDQWPAGPLTTVGRDAPRVDGPERARGEADYTADLAFRACCTRRSCAARTPAPACGVARPRPAREAPGVRAALGPGELERLTDEPGYVGAPVAAVRPTRTRWRAAAIELIDVDWEVLEPLVDPDEAVERESPREPRRYERGDLERGLAEADAVVEAEYRTQVALHNCMEPHGAVCRWEGRHARGLHLDPVHLGRPRRVAEQFGLPDRVRVVCNFMGGGFGSKNGPATTPTSRRSSRNEPAVPCAASTTAARRTSTRATGTGRSSGSSRAHAPTGR